MICHRICVSSGSFLTIYCTTEASPHSHSELVRPPVAKSARVQAKQAARQVPGEIHVCLMSG